MGALHSYLNVSKPSSSIALSLFVLFVSCIFEEEFTSIFVCMSNATVRDVRFPFWMLTSLGRADFLVLLSMLVTSQLTMLCILPVKLDPLCL